MKFHTIVVDTRTRDTILAALRLYESMLVTGTPVPEDEHLDTKEINDLCEKLRREE